jgi:hypothetical protein
VDTFQRGALLFFGALVFCGGLAATAAELVDRASLSGSEAVGPGLITGFGLACLLLALGAHRR